MILMNSDQIDLLANALIKYNLLPPHRITKEEQNDYTRMRTVLKKGKQKNILRFAELALLLIKDKTTLNPELTENHSDFFVKIINSYPDMTTSEIVELMVQQRQDAERLRQELSKELFETKQNLTEKVKDLQKDNHRLREEFIASEKTRTEYFNQLSQYDSDCDDKSEDIDYEQLARLSEKDDKINELSMILYERDYEIKKLKQIIDQNEHFGNEVHAKQSEPSPTIIDDEPKEDPKMSAREWDRRMREEHEAKLAKNRARFSKV
jgi:hypothetical protein